MIHSHEFEVGGKTLSLETGRVAKQAGGSVLLGMGETVILAAATMSAEPRAGIDFLPLTVDYEERRYSVGKIPGGFIKRGGRPSEKAILVSRLIDRPLRPQFPKGLRNDVQVIAMPFAVDQECPPDVLAICAAGAAVAISDIPANGYTAGVRVGRINGEFILFPSIPQINESDLDLVVAGHEDAISMVEAGSTEVSEEDMHAALKFAHEAIKKISAEFKVFADKVNKPKREVKLFEIDKDLVAMIQNESGADIAAAIVNPDKASRESAIHEMTKELVEKYTAKLEGQDEKIAQLNEAVDKVIKTTVRRLIIDENKRPDGRGPEDIRPLEAIAGLLPKVHGSGLFTRGQTQVMTVLTLGLPNEAQSMDGLEEEDDKRYMHFYNFPPYSVGETRQMRGPGRREVGHGALAERALKPMIPLDNPDFPYTILLTSEVLESNGSTSMASVCGSTLALMDGGIQLKAPVAGIAMGLMSDGKTYKVLTDIQGMEDFSGDMDFKVAGTRKGITALQLDTKLEGIPDDVLARALNQAKTARMQILDVIEAEIPEPRSEVAPTAPRVTTIMINPEKIGAVIGPGGAVIKKITGTTGASVDIQQDGRVLIGGTNGEAVQQAITMIKSLTDEVAVGAEFRGKVTRLMGRGAMVEYINGREGLVPTEQLTVKAVRRPDDVVSVGDELNVKVHEIDGLGRINLTALGLPQTLPSLSENESATPPPPGPPRGGGRDRGGRGGDRDRGRGGRDRDRGGRGGYGGRDRGDRGDRGGRDRYSRSDRPDESDKSERSDRPEREYEREHAVTDSEPRAPHVPDEFPRRDRRTDDESVNARFRPRR